MNYTGGPSISGCRPVLSLYPTHCFCQYLLRIFITFTNSSLFTRAFSTNSRKPSPSLLRNATSPKGRGLGRPRKVNGFARGSPTRGAGERSETERLYGGEPDRKPLLNSTSPSRLRRATSPTEGRLWQSPQSERFRQRLPY